MALLTGLGSYDDGLREDVVAVVTRAVCDVNFVVKRVAYHMHRVCTRYRLRNGEKSAATLQAFIGVFYTAVYRRKGGGVEPAAVVPAVFPVNIGAVGIADVAIAVYQAKLYPQRIGCVFIMNGIRPAIGKRNVRYL